MSNIVDSARIFAPMCENQLESIDAGLPDNPN